MKKISKIPKFDRPREKLKKRGQAALSNLELLVAILGKGIKGKDVFEVAKDVLKLFNQGYSNIRLNELENIEGVGPAKAAQILAALEFSKRFLIKPEIKINSSENAVKLVEELKNKKQEYFITLTLDGASNLLQKRVVFIGTINHSIIHPREIFADAITDRASGIIFIHNHPTGNCEPSEDDFLITNRLLKVANIVGIQVIDHIIITKNNFYSFKSQDKLNGENV